MNEREDRFLGCLTGLAVGDAVGTTLEFRSPGTFKPIDDMVGGGPFGPVFKLLRDGSVEDFTRGPGFLDQSTIDTQRHAGHATGVADRYTQSRI